MATDDVIVIDPPGLRALAGELQAAVESALDMRGRLCMEECSMLPSNTGGVADELLEDARRRLHELAGAFSMTARALNVRADEVEASQCCWWSVSPDGGLDSGVILGDGTYVSGPTATSSAWGAGASPMPTATSSAWGSGASPMPTATSSAWGAGSSPMPTSTSSAWGAGTVALPPEILGLGAGSGSIGTVSLPIPLSGVDVPSGTGSVSIPIAMGGINFSTGTGSVALPMPGGGINLNTPTMGGMAALMEGQAMGRIQDLQKALTEMRFGLANSGVDVGTISNYDQVAGNLGNAANQAMDPSRGSNEIDLSGTSDGRG